MANILFLRLESPLQSWGERSRWSVRDTGSVPTKSGVIGLLGCAMGIGVDVRLVQLSDGLNMGVRIDKAGTRLTDYHTIGGGYKTPQLLTAVGRPKESSGAPHTEISWRDYLVDASFLVALQGTTDLVAKAALALQNPIWTIFLGRKSCPPSRPVFDGMAQYDSLVSALRQHQWPANVAQRTAVIECAPNAPSAVRRLDQLASRCYRCYHPRYTQTILLNRDKGE